MKILNRIAISFLVLFYLPLALAAPSPEGTWTTIDDKTGEKRAVVYLSVSEGLLNGKIVQVFKQKGDTGICSKCPASFKDQPIQGMQFLWGLKDEGHGIWDKGHILDAKTGKIYKVKLKVEGNKLFVRGYVGISLLGRTQVWVK